MSYNNTPGQSGSPDGQQPWGGQQAWPASQQGQQNQPGQQAWPASQQGQQQSYNAPQSPNQTPSWGQPQQAQQPWNSSANQQQAQQSYAQQPYPVASSNTGSHQQLVAGHPYQGQVQQSTNRGPIGKVRNTGVCILLSLVTFGIYSLIWTYCVYSEMKRHRGAGTGGGLAVLLSFIPCVTAFMTPSTVADMYRGAGRQSPVSAVTGCWIFLPVAGPLIWFIQTNNAINDYWKSVGPQMAQG